MIHLCAVGNESPGNLNDHCIIVELDSEGHHREHRRWVEDIARADVESRAVTGALDRVAVELTLAERVVFVRASILDCVEASVAAWMRQIGRSPTTNLAMLDTAGASARGMTSRCPSCLSDIAVSGVDVAAG